MRALLAAVLVVAGCGGSMCGNGKIESGEECDDGNTEDGDGCSSTCRFVQTIDTYVHFQSFIAHQFPGFSGETCGGLGIKEVEVAVTGPKTVFSQVDCGFGQVKLSSLPAGDYVATARAFDRDGALLSRGLAHAEFTHGDVQQDVDIDWPFEDFLRSYTGTFYFDILWGGSRTCAGAVPPVFKQRLRLERDGVPLPGMTGAGDLLDGSLAGPCQSVNPSFAQSATDLPWGPAKLTVTGEDDAGTPLFQGSFDTFVGAGVGNPTVNVDVPSLSPDAGTADGGGG